MAGLEPASELQYRTLHQTNWPGVVDQMARSNRRYWVTFLIDFGEQLWLFTYSEYVGDDYAADDAATAADPVTQRWWKFTEPCLIPLTPGGENWTTMQALMR
ncbi:MAG: L-rhamnose mutarotase [Opitutaceae bacterium]|nr:L-rhamnose mutarotase [Opitutaceae bacterium]